MSRVAIVGAGNLGAYLATELRTAGHDIFFCARRDPGTVRFAGRAEQRFPFYLKDPPAADITLLTVKTYDTAGALPWLQKLCAAGQPAAVIQNGVNHAERVAPFAAIPVLSYVYVEAHEGVYHAFPPRRAPFTIPAGEECQVFAELFANSAIWVERETEFHTAAWRKMLHNCVSNPLTTLAGRGLEILREAAYRELAEGILREALPIAQRDGAQVKLADADEILAVLHSYPPGTRTSMLQDFEAGKRLETEALNGTVVRMGKRFGLPTPVNEQVLERLRAKGTAPDA